MDLLNEEWKVQRSYRSVDASEVTTLWHYTNMLIIITSTIFLSQAFLNR